MLNNVAQKQTQTFNTVKQNPNSFNAPGVNTPISTKQEGDSVQINNKIKTAAIITSGSALGGIAGGILGFIKEKSKYQKDTMIENKTRDLQDEICGKFYDEVKNTFDKVKAGVNLTEEEKTLLKDLGFNHPLFKFLDKDIQNKYLTLNDKQSVINGIHPAYSYPNAVYSSGPGSLAIGFHGWLNKKSFNYIDFLEKKTGLSKENEELFSLLGKDFQNQLKKVNDKNHGYAAIPAMDLTMGKFLPDGGGIDKNGMFIAKITGAECDYSELADAFSGLPGSEKSLQIQLNKKYGTALENAAKEAATNVDKLIKNNSFKAAIKPAVIAAIIVGGISAIGTFLYSNKKNETNNK